MCHYQFKFSMRLYRFPGKNVCNLVVASQLRMLKAWHWRECHSSNCKITLCAIHLDECMRGEICLWRDDADRMVRDDIQGDCCPDTNGNTQYATNAGKGNGKAVFGKVLWDGRKKDLWEGGWKERDHNIQMADWDLAPWVGEKVTETNGFLCLVWLRGCTKPEIMCWYLLGAAWR